MKAIIKQLITFSVFLIVGSCALAQNYYSDAQKVIKPRMRVIVLNEFSVDPDGYFQLVHQLLSPSAEVRAVIGTHLKPNDPFDNSNVTAQNAQRNAQELVTLMGMKGKFPVLAGSNVGLTNTHTPTESEATDFIIKEALRTDTKLPLYVVSGAGLTDVASALLKRPEIAKKFTLVWIGGSEYEGINLPPNHSTPEYNLGISVPAAQVVFNQSEVMIWQVPRNAYRQVLMSHAELTTRVKSQGKLGQFLAQKIEGVMELTQRFDLHIGETYIQGDNPLVLLTALQSSFEADPSSSLYRIVAAPQITDKGTYKANPSGRKIRVYDQLDTRLLLEDFYAKLQLFNK